MCVELLHEGANNHWVKSWGLDSRFKYLVHVSSNNTHTWYNLGNLRQHITNRVLDNTYALVNNTLKTRETHGKPSSNVLNVWVPHGASSMFTHSEGDSLIKLRDNILRHLV